MECGDESMIYCQTFDSLHKNEITNVYFLSYYTHNEFTRAMQIRQKYFVSLKKYIHKFWIIISCTFEVQY